jgi:chemotaxis protein CheD
MKVYDGTDADQAPEPDADPGRIKVGIAEYAVSTDGAVLTTSGLGSCIGLALHDPHSGVAGLAHVMLPVCDDSSGGDPAKFADTGTSLLVEEVTAAGADPATLKGKLAGGSEMLDFSTDGQAIGRRNAEVVRETLADHDIPVVATDVGGDHGRSLRLEPGTGDLVVTSANKGTERL